MKAMADRILPKSLRDGLERVFIAHNGVRAARAKGKASTKTQRERRSAVLLCFAQLWEMGYRVQRPDSIAPKHLDALVQRWLSEGLKPNTLHPRWSAMSLFLRWIGKAGMVRPIDTAFPPDAVRRSFISRNSAAWNAKSVDPEDVIETLRLENERLAVLLAVQHHFGLRVKEAIELRPAHALVESGKAIEIYAGTKGGRLRRIPIETEAQRQTFEWARDLAARNRDGRLRWPGLTWRQAQNRFYYQLGKLGFTRRKLGLTAHGLRHGYAQRDYRRHSGFPTPVEGGAVGLITREAHRSASLATALHLGHGRPEVGSNYYGSYGHAFRRSPFAAAAQAEPKVVSFSVTYGQQTNE